MRPTSINMPHIIPCKMFSISILLFVAFLHSCFALIIQKGQTSTISPLHHDFFPVLPSMPSTTTLSSPSQKIVRDVKSSTILDAFKISPNTIIRTKESRSLGARYLNESQTSSREECLTWCWKVAGCNLAVFEEQGHRSCYLFDCGSPDDFKCKFTSHESYTTALLNRASLDLDEWRDETDHENDLLLLRSTPPSSHVNSQITSRSLESTTDLSSTQTSSIKTQKKESSCQRFQFQCKNSTECIAIYNVCDGIPQCSDGSDELHCDTRSRITEGGEGTSSLSSSVSRPGKSVEEEDAETEMMRKKMQEVHQQQQHQASLSSSKSPSPVKSVSQGQGNSELESPSMFHYPKVPSEGTFLKEPQTPPQAPLSSFFHRRPYSSYLSNSQSRVPQSIGPQNSQQPQPPPISQSFLPPQQQESSFSNNYYGNYPYMIPADFYGQGEVKPVSKILPPNSGSYIDSDASASGPLFWPVMSPDNTRVNGLDSQTAVETGVSNGAPIGQEKSWRQKLERYQSNNLFNNRIVNTASDSNIVPDRFHKLPNPISDDITKATTVKPQIPESEGNSRNEKTEKENPKGIVMSKLKAPLSHEDAIAVTHLRDSDPSGRDTNSAVIALTLGLSITAMLIGLVGCRMNSIKKKIARRGGRGLAHDADYLVNGMYL